jgi:hypothetical protein
MKVYIGGCLGETPAVVADSVETAMQETLDGYCWIDKETQCRDEQWTCWFLDGYRDQLRCTITITTPQGETRKLYVERYDLDTAQDGDGDEVDAA